MSDCPELRRILERLGDEVTDREHQEIRRHVEHCEVCQAQFERLRWVPDVVREVGRISDDGGDHPDNLQLAAFAERGYGADDAGEIVTHLSQCHDCREVVTAAWRAVVEHTDERASESSAPAPIFTLISRFATPRRAACALGALVAFAAECVLLAVAVTQFVLAWVVEPIGFESVPAFWPLGVLDSSLVRFWVLVTACLVTAALLRWVAGHLFFCAMIREERRGEAR